METELIAFPYGLRVLRYTGPLLQSRLRKITGICALAQDLPI